MKMDERGVMRDRLAASNLIKGQRTEAAFAFEVPPAVTAIMIGTVKRKPLKDADLRGPRESVSAVKIRVSDQAVPCLRSRLKVSSCGFNTPHRWTAFHAILTMVRSVRGLFPFAPLSLNPFHPFFMHHRLRH
jgi:hypothetical protein